jgi:hypothetical protein
MSFFARFKDTRVASSDIIFILLKLTAMVALILWLGALYGIIIVIVSDYMIDLAIRIFFGLEPLNSTDKNVFHDQLTNRCNIMASLVFEHCDEDVIREVFQRKMPA